MSVYEKLIRKLGKSGRLLETQPSSYTNTDSNKKYLNGDFSRHLDRDLVIVDVGCRWGFADVWTQLLSRIHLYGFDPDEEECERLRQLYKDRNVTLVSQALADTPGKRVLYLTQNPGCNSLYRPDPRLTSAMPELACASQVGTSKIEVTTLDLWSAATGTDVVDFIKLDTQGSELDILRGGKEILRTVRALEIEVEFNPIYENQPLFNDVDIFLREQGFVLWRLSNMVHYSRGTPLHQRQTNDTAYYDSKPVQQITFGGQLYWGHAHYLRHQIVSDENHSDPRQNERDAVLLKALGFHDIALRLTTCSSGPDPAPGDG